MPDATRTDEVLMGFAVAASQFSDAPNGKVGCSIFKGINLICSGYNQAPAGAKWSKERWEDAEFRKPCAIHAEMDAISNTRLSLEGCTAYVTAHPCPRCMSLLIHNQIIRVAYLVDEAYEKSHAKDLFLSAKLAAEFGIRMKRLETL